MQILHMSFLNLPYQTRGDCLFIRDKYNLQYNKSYKSTRYSSEFAIGVKMQINQFVFFIFFDQFWRLFSESFNVPLPSLPQYSYKYSESAKTISIKIKEI